MLFLNALDQKEAEEEARARALAAPFTPSIEPPYRWRDWAAPPDDPLPLFRQDGFQSGWKRRELTEAPLGAFLNFVNNQVFPYLRDLGHRPGATDRQRVIGMIFVNKERTIRPSAARRARMRRRSSPSRPARLRSSSCSTSLIPWPPAARAGWSLTRE